MRHPRIGNHFLEIQRMDKIYNLQVAKAFGVHHEGQVTVMIHCGSHGFGHQVCSDYLRVMERAVQKYNISLPDRELACAPGTSNEAEDYYQAMACAVNYAFANRLNQQFLLTKPLKVFVIKCECMAVKEKLYTVKQASEILGVHPKTIQKWDREGKIKVIRTPGGRRRIPESEIKRLLGLRLEEGLIIGYARVSSHT